MEIDRLQWQEGWHPRPAEVYRRMHDEVLGKEAWVIDGLGEQSSIASRFSRATEIILIDMPMWMHFWLAAERQIAWTTGRLENAPGGLSQMPSTEALFRTIWEVEQAWMPGIRALCSDAEAMGKRVVRLSSVRDLDDFAGGAR